MYPSSTSSSSHGTTNSSNGSGNLIRYGSAPNSLLTSAMDSVIGTTRDFSVLGPGQTHLTTAHFFPSEANTESTQNMSSRVDHHSSKANNTTIGLERSSYGFPHGGAASSSPMFRQSSLPAGFHNQANDNNGFSITKGMASYNNNTKPTTADMNSSHGVLPLLKSQLSFTRQQQQEPLSRIIEETERTDVVNGINGGHRKSTQSNYTNNNGFSIGYWDNNNPAMFNFGHNKQAKNGHGNMESQFQFTIPLEMATMENLLHIPQDSVPCKLRAKRGHATHPRSIAEREADVTHIENGLNENIGERRTRISGKLKKLHDIVPNMDKQTSYSDMLDLAVQHIKSLQSQLQKLNKELDNCTCGCKKIREST